MLQFTLRHWQIADLPSLVRYANNPNIAKWMMDSFPHPYQEKDGQEFIALTMKHTPRRLLAIDVAGEAVGGIGLHPQQDISRMNAELGYWLAEPFWGNRITSNAIKQIVNFGFATFPINRIYARVAGTNIASQKALSNAGLIKEAHFEKTIFKNGLFEDEIIYAIRR